MQAPLRFPLTLSASLVLASLAGAQDGAFSYLSHLQLTAAEVPPRNRVGLTYRPGFNLTATFKGIGGFPALSNPGLGTGGGQDRTYDDGYNRRDISPDDGLTWNWGYVQASQIVDGSLHLSSSSALPSGVVERNDGPQQGFEVTYRRRIGEPGPILYGLEAAFNFTGIKIRSAQSVRSTAQRLTDAYDLGGIIPPQAPPPAWAYEGTFLGPGALISDTPVRLPLTTIPGGAWTTGQRSLEASLYGWRLGPYVEFPFWKRFTFSLSGGLALGLVDSEFAVNEITSLTGAGTVANEGRDTQSELLAGVYVAGQFTFALSPSLDLSAGVQYQHLETFRQWMGHSEVYLNLDRGVFMTLGLGFSF
jgi:hypothetical protein